MGTEFSTPPSTSRRPSCWTGGKMPGSAQLASNAGISSPDAKTTSSPVVRSQATTRSGTWSSANVRAGWPRSMISTRPRFDTRWSSRRSTFHTRWSRPPGNSRSPSIPSHTSSSRSIPASVGRVATAAALSEPADEPMTTSGTMSRSNSARSIPTWLMPWFPPPESTNAVVRRWPFSHRARAAIAKWRVLLPCSPPCSRTIGVVGGTDRESCLW